MKENKEPLFDAIDTVELCLDATEGMLAGVEFDRERLEDASGDEMLAATEIADLLVRNAVERGRALSDSTLEELRERSEHLDESYYEVLKRSSWLESKRIEGGTGSAPPEGQVAPAPPTPDAPRSP